MKKLGFLPAALLCAACAKAPDAIAPVSMGNAFAAVSCKDARTQLAEEQQTLAALEEQQRNARTGDAIGVFLILVPVSSITGNSVEGELATSKGKVVALENRLQSC
ncbi:hypothetical protein So717_35000 [Roseobacter cerasinus]|uniref:Lipoprotein n=1 Tax=Roseobacter cerasinus TaxID=2602289 RepID=A0A640VV63_9RHOB|nr:hypothetical protein [Roseobacter cerasinus]GFE51747.1 hypothetical protein So717_35000 [Roseobacter cerasinus]